MVNTKIQQSRIATAHGVHETVRACGGLGDLQTHKIGSAIRGAERERSKHGCVIILSYTQGLFLVYTVLIVVADVVGTTTPRRT